MKVKNRTIKALLVATGVVLFWRGAWGLMDLYLFPNNLPLSFVSSLLLGILVLKLTHHLIDELM